jgi:hypothetical protein
VPALETPRKVVLYSCCFGGILEDSTRVFPLGRVVCKVFG